MKLLVDIDDRLFERVRRLSHAKTKKEAIVISLTEYIKLHDRRQAAKLIGNLDLGGLSGLKRSRKQWKRSS